MNSEIPARGKDFIHDVKTSEMLRRISRHRNNKNNNKQT